MCFLRIYPRIFRRKLKTFPADLPAIDVSCGITQGFFKGSICKLVRSNISCGFCGGNSCRQLPEDFKSRRKQLPTKVLLEYHNPREIPQETNFLREFHSNPQVNCRFLVVLPIYCKIPTPAITVCQK
ncbi:hypothetical protein QL285_022462 [Trifolium repens]|nr:hypothetical protein QL285_022462 [Trifolium repens]